MKNRKYKYFTLILILIFIIIYILIYCCFKGNGIWAAGVGLKKSDWLAFLGTYLAFAGSIIVSLIAIFQSHYFANVENDRRKMDRKNMLQPIFSINIVEKNSAIFNVGEAVDLYGKKGNTVPHRNVVLSIENVGAYPIRNVILFGTYFRQMIKQCQKEVIQIAYSDSPDVKKHKDKVTEIFEATYPRDEEGIPMRFTIQYDDIDGNKMQQTFLLEKYNNEKYYSLDSMQSVDDII